MGKGLGMVAFAAGAATVFVDPNGLAGHTAYFSGFLVLVAASWWAALRPTCLTRVPWVLIALTQTVWAGADILFAVLSARDPDLQFSLCDLLWLSGYPLLAVSMLTMVRRRAPGHARAGILDGLTMASAAAMCTWLIVVAPSLGDQPIAMDLVQVLYPAGDVILLLAASFLALTPGRQGGPTRLLLLGVGVTFVGDTAISLLADVASLTTQARFDAVFLLANASIVAATCSRQRDTELLTPPTVWREPVHPARLLFLGGALLAGPMIFVARGTLSLPERVTVGVGSTLTVAFALTRFSLAILEQARSQRELAYYADHDDLTGLANRRALTDVLTEQFDPESDLVLLYLDLDGFKAVNDTYGHAAGDAVLAETARRLEANVRKGDLVARLGGDEFAVLCLGLTVEELPILIDRLEQALREPVAHRGALLRLSGSVGVGSVAGCSGPDELINRADAAMFEAKRAARAGG